MTGAASGCWAAGVTGNEEERDGLILGLPRAKQAPSYISKLNILVWALCTRNQQLGQARLLTVLLAVG